MAETATAARALTQERITCGEVELEVHRGGSGPSLLFLHGSGGVHPGAPVFNLLTRHFSVTAPVHPGFGTSSLPFWMDSVDDFVHVHLELMEKLDLRDVILVGTFLGGWVAADLATKNRSRIAKIVLVSPVGIKVGPRDQLDIPDIFARSMKDVDALKYADPARYGFTPEGKSDEELRTMARNRETLALVSWDPYMHNPKLKHRLHVIDRPTLFLRGEADRLVSQAYVEAYAGLIPGSRVETIPGAGHTPPVEQPEDFVARILRFAKA
jgi:pimeloyl-ACP methyl ester carboxylesterase